MPIFLLEDKWIGVGVLSNNLITSREARVLPYTVE
jgi:hypothetical protein